MGPLLGDRYQVVHPLWRDRLGETYVARDRRTGTPVTVRTLRGDLAAPPVARRLHEERHRLTALRHPHLAAVLDLTEDRDALIIVSEAVEGATLRHRLRTGRPPDRDEVARIAAGVAAGLHAMHDAGLLHQNLRADTVVLTRTGEVRLTDVALAHLVSATAAGRDRLRAAAPAPELADGAAPGPAADLFALGVLLRDLSRRGPVRGLARRLRARDPRSRPTARQAHTVSASASARTGGRAGPGRPEWSGSAPSPG
ncbi:protein kinase domain-containing protein [Actinophytocola gossypii]|uniref:non-specific serine/threonine protein kinase n=1 Tax=Actinophytocola gossypii TaxID=2812003 RepID=A0ABT2J3Y2_9PSEU|nr:protein kinase [Actinophytocola gossypii]MCT2582386.1 protein kinase [Actinophytocola gossypii]